MSANACSTISAIATQAQAAADSQNDLVSSLQRLSSIMAQTAATRANFSGFPRVSDIDTNVFNSIKASCPFFPAASVGDLQNILSNSYSDLLKSLRRSPSGKLGQLQNLLNRMQAKNPVPINVASYLRCVSTICSTPQNLQESYNNTVSTYDTNFVTNGGNALSPAATTAKTNNDSALQFIQGLAGN